MWIHNITLERVIILIGMSHETRIHNIVLKSVIIIGVSHETQNHNIVLDSVIFMIGVLGEKNSNERATLRLFLWYVLSSQILWLDSVPGLLFSLVWMFWCA